MDINGICTAGYPAAGHETRKTGRNAAGMNFAKQAAAAQAEAALHGADAASGDIAVFSSADIASGSSVSVYKTPDFDPQNPVYKVKIWDRAGKVTEQMVDVSKVDPQNCDTIEMYAYTANMKESGKGSFENTVLKAAVAKAVKDAEDRSAAWSFSKKLDWTKIVSDVMQSEYRYGDLKGYMEWKKFLGLLETVEGKETEKAEKKVVQDKAAEYDEQAFDLVGPNAPQDVRDAWMEAAKKVNANGMGICGNGMMTHISQMMVQRCNKILRGETENLDILGNTVESAILAAKQALYNLEHPTAYTPRSIEVQQARIREREFYNVFLEKLEQLR